MEIITSILIILGTGLVLGQAFETYRLAGIAGEILGGLILGPAVIGIIRPSSVLSSIADISLFFIVLLIGIDVTTRVLTKSYTRSIPLSFSSFLLPSLVMTLILVLIFHLPLNMSVIAAIATGVPSISIISVLLRDYKVLQKPAGQAILSSVVISDLLAFAFLSSLSGGDLVLRVTAILAFILVLFYVDFLLTRNSERIIGLFSKLHAAEHGEKIIFGIVILGGLLASTFFQAIGFTFVLGAFFSGMLISELVVGKEVLGVLTRTLGRINDSFFIPVYFTIAGIDAVIPPLKYIIVMIALLAVTAVGSPLLTYRLSKALKMDMKPKSTAGFLGGRGAVGVVIAATALSLSLINENLYSMILFATVIQAIVLPLLIEKDIEGTDTTPAA
ncbi:MAG: cation:proton antiporter [Methanomassiliicoccales archaeon]